MKKLILVASLIFISFVLCSENSNVFPEWIKDNPFLGHYLSIDELSKMDEIGRYFSETVPPIAPVRNIAEFEHMEGVLIRYPFGISYSIIAEMSEDVMVTTIVASTGQQTSVTNSYNSHGVNLDNCNFLIASSDSYWTRDYGPWYVVDGNNDVGIVNFPYNRPRPNDNDIPIAMSEFLDVELYGMNLIHTGGNYMTDGMGISASSDLVYDENRLSFESGEFGDIWNFGGNANWFIDNSIANDYYYSARSGELEDNQTTSLSVELFVIDIPNHQESISFYKKISCENSTNDDTDYLVFLIDGIERERWDGEIDWSKETFSISPGNHTFEWLYIKNETISEGLDCAWIDDILFPILNITIPKYITHLLVEDYLGIENYHVVPDPNNTYIDHIDCWGKFLDVDKILIRSVPSYHSQYDELEETAAYFAAQISSYGTPYEVYRIYTPNDQPYTNSLILNNKVLVPITGSSWDNDALSTYETAMPGYEILGFTGGWVSTDALHCRAKGVADRGMLYIYHIPVHGEIPAGNDINIQAEIIPYSEEPLYEDSLFVFYKIDDEEYNQILMTHIENYTYSADIPAQEDGTEVGYFIHAADQSGRSANHPYIGAPDPHIFYIGPPITPILSVNPSFFEKTLEQDTTDTEMLLLSNIGGGIINYTIDIIGRERVITTNLNNNPEILKVSVPENKLQSSSLYKTNINFTLEETSFVTLEIYNFKEKKIRTLVQGKFPAKNHSVHWDFKDDDGNNVPDGYYYLKLSCKEKTVTTEIKITK